MSNYDKVAAYLDKSPKDLSEGEFKRYLIKAFRLERYPKVETMYFIARKWGKIGGYYQILEVFSDLTMLIGE